MSGGKIFISYRRADSAYAAGRLYDRLCENFGEENIFMDVEGLDPGVDFVESIENAISFCDVLLALMGPQWLTVTDETGQRRLDNPKDFVRVEIAAALERGVRIIPILVQGARMPEAWELPENLHRLVRLNALEIRHERFNADTDRLVRAIDKYMREAAEAHADFAMAEAVQKHSEPSVRIATSLAVEDSGPTNWGQQIFKRFRFVPRRLWYMVGGIGLVFMLLLTCWGGNKLIAFLRTTETLQAVTPTSSVSEVIIKTDIPQPATSAATVLSTDTQRSSSTNTPIPDPTMTPSHTPDDGLPKLIVDDFGVPMALVPAGPFEMGINVDKALVECQKVLTGCERGWFDKEKPIHTVMLGNFYIDQYEVTNANYASCVEAGFCDPPWDTESSPPENYYGNASYADYPVISVSWYDAETYCWWRNTRLPTEAEWEKAARGGLEGALYSWGDTFDGTLANFCDVNCNFEHKDTDFNDGYADTAPVGSFVPNGYGLYDMAGNVWEWVADWYDPEYYKKSSTNNPLGPENGEDRVLRGGSWYDVSFSLQVALRYGDLPDFPDNRFGFRCVRDIVPSEDVTP
jgi:formylglycine-generating enzyme required for sulfatase activity